jgi:hypothetical protein
MQSSPQRLLRAKLSNGLSATAAPCMSVSRRRAAVVCLVNRPTVERTPKFSACLSSLHQASCTFFHCIKSLAPFFTVSRDLYGLIYNSFLCSCARTVASIELTTATKTSIEVAQSHNLVRLRCFFTCTQYDFAVVKSKADDLLHIRDYLGIAQPANERARCQLPACAWQLTYVQIICATRDQCLHQYR